MKTEQDMTAELEELGTIKTNIEYIKRDIQEIKEIITHRNDTCTKHAETIANHESSIGSLQEIQFELSKDFNGFKLWLIGALAGAVVSLILTIVNLLGDKL